MKRNGILIGFLLASALWAVYLVLQSDASAYHQICETNQYTEKERCAPHHIPYVISWYIGYWFDKASAVITAFATAAIAALTVVLARVGKNQSRDARIIQRPYVTISHRAPGIDVKGNSGILYIDVTIENFGQTPATITDIVLKPVVVELNASLPGVPDYSGDGPPDRKAFLVAKDNFAIFQILTITPEEIIAVRDFFCHLYIIGFVDYLDRFGERHRAGYARRYAPIQDMRPGDMSDEVYATRNNLFFVPQEGYNYDRPRVRGEGNDWG